MDRSEREGEASMIIDGIEYKLEDAKITKEDLCYQCDYWKDKGWTDEDFGTCTGECASDGPFPSILRRVSNDED
jgi:hypothetical protein